MNPAFGWLPERDGHLQCPDREVTLHAVTHSPADDAPGMQIQGHGQIQPALARPDVADITRPFLVRLICHDVTIQQVWRNVELMIAVPLSAGDLQSKSAERGGDVQRSDQSL